MQLPYMQRLLIFPSARARACSRMRAIEGGTGEGPGRCAAVATTIVPCKHCSWDSQQFSCGACVQAESRLASVVSVASVLLCWRHGVLSGMVCFQHGGLCCNWSWSRLFFSNGNGYACGYIDHAVAKSVN